MEPLLPDEQRALEAVPHKYVPLTLAGIGNQATVFFCLPRTLINSLEPSRSSNPSHQEVSHLRSQVVVVKMPSPKSALARLGTQNELRALREIGKKVEGNGKEHVKRLFTSLVDADAEGTEDKCKWYALRALTPAITLQALRYSVEFERDVSRVMAAQLFLDVSSALGFLHEEMGLAHSDLHDGNVVLTLSTTQPTDPSSQAVQRQEQAAQTPRPHFVLIDFGHAGPIDKWASCRHEDVTSLCERVHSLLKPSPPTLLTAITSPSSSIAPSSTHAENIKWLDMQRTLYAVAWRSAEMALEKLHERFESFAKEVVGEAGEEIWERVRGVVDEEGRGLAYLDRRITDVIREQGNE